MKIKIWLTVVVLVGAIFLMACSNSSEPPATIEITDVSTFVVPKVFGAIPSSVTDNGGEIIWGETIHTIVKTCSETTPENPMVVLSDSSNENFFIEPFSKCEEDNPKVRCWFGFMVPFELRNGLSDGEGVFVKIEDDNGVVSDNTYFIFYPEIQDPEETDTTCTGLDDKHCREVVIDYVWVEMSPGSTWEKAMAAAGELADVTGELESLDIYQFRVDAEDTEDLERIVGELMKQSGVEAVAISEVTEKYMGNHGSSDRLQIFIQEPKQTETAPSLVEDFLSIISFLGDDIVIIQKFPK